MVSTVTVYLIIFLILVFLFVYVRPKRNISETQLSSSNFPARSLFLSNQPRLLSDRSLLLSEKCKQGRYILLPSTGIFFSDPDPKIYNKELASALLAVAFNVEISNCKNMGTIPSMTDFDVQIPIKGKTITGEDRMLGYFFYCTFRKTCIISFTGTFYLDEWYKDSEISQVSPNLLNNYQEGVLMHKGFYQLYMGIADVIRELTKYTSIKKLYITGHSLGAAMSTVCAYDLAALNPVVYNFASPRVFNPLGADIYKKNIQSCFRVANSEDMVTTFPLPILKNTFYEHVDFPIEFTNNLDAIWFNHTYAYLKHYNLAAKGWEPPV